MWASKEVTPLFYHCLAWCKDHKGFCHCPNYIQLLPHSYQVCPILLSIGPLIAMLFSSDPILSSIPLSRIFSLYHLLWMCTPCITPFYLSHILWMCLLSSTLQLIFNLQESLILLASLLKAYSNSQAHHIFLLQNRTVACGLLSTQTTLKIAFTLWIWS